MSQHYQQRKKANEKYLAEQDRITIRVSKESGLKKIIQAHTEQTGESVQAFIIRAITETIECDKYHKHIINNANAISDLLKE